MGIASIVPRPPTAAKSVMRSGGRLYFWEIAEDITLAIEDPPADMISLAPEIFAQL